MKFKQISILPNLSRTDFNVSFLNIDGDRVDRGYTINYNTITYGSHIRDEQAFFILCSHLKKEINERIYMDKISIKKIDNIINNKKICDKL